MLACGPLQTCRLLTFACRFLRCYSTKDYYKVLGVKSSSSHDEIKKAFFEKSKQLHPDINPNDPSKHDRFVKLNEAYTVLGKSISRREYDFGRSTREINARYYQQAYENYAAGRPQKSGRNFYEDNAREHTFWDETLHPMRDKSTKDKYSENDNYYGFVGIKKQPHYVIVIGIVIFIILGAILHTYIIRKSRDYHIRKMDLKDRRLMQQYNAAKERARTNSVEKQLQLLRDNVARNSKDQDIGRNQSDK